MKWFWNTFFVGKAAAWTALSTVVLMVFSGLLWRVNDKANETSVATQRAFISFSGPAFAKDTEGKKLNGIKVYYGMANSGTTPVRDGVSEWNISLGPTTAEKGLDFDRLPQDQRYSFVLGPKGGFQMAPISISSEDLEAVAKGEKHLFFWGWTTYRDIFDGTLTSPSFCTTVSEKVYPRMNLFGM